MQCHPIADDDEAGSPDGHRINSNYIYLYLDNGGGIMKTRGTAEHCKSDRYSLSFTTGSLFHHESVKLAALYLELGDWNAVRDRVVADNLLQTRTLNTLKRVCREVISRLEILCRSQLELLVEGCHQEQAYLLWIAVCRRYKFIADFAIEVLRERYITLKPDLSFDDFDAFFNQKYEWHLELDKISPTTQNKLRQVLFRILREADLLTGDNIINTALFSPRLLEVMHISNREDVLYFPVFESSQECVKR